MNNLTSKNENGFTLVELILYIALLTILLGFLIYIFAGIIDLKVKSQNTQLIQEDGRFLLSRLEFDVGAASDVELVDSHDLKLHICGSLYEYTFSGNTLMFNSGGTMYELNSNTEKIDPDSFSFNVFNNSGTKKQMVQVKFTLQSLSNDRNGNSVTSIPFETTIGLR